MQLLQPPLTPYMGLCAPYPQDGLMQPEPFIVGLCPTPLFYGAMRPIPAGAFLCEESSTKNALETSGFKTSGREGEDTFPLSTPPVSAPIGVLYYKTGSQ